MSALTLITWIALAFMTAAILLWAFLLWHRWRDNQRLRWAAKTRDLWLERILVALEEPTADLTQLPKPKTLEGLEVVLSLLREVAERFRGQYRIRIAAILIAVGAREHAFDCLASRREADRIRGAALLGWMGPDSELDRRLQAALMDGSPTVRLEAAYSLGMRGANAIPFQEVFTALRGTPALRSERARDIVRHFAPGNAPAIQSMLLRASEWREKVLLLHGMAASGDLSGTELVASLLKDEHARVRVAAIQALVTMGDPTHAPAVLALAADPDPRVRLAVAQYASGLREIDSSTPLETLALDADFDVQRTAIHGLVSLGGPRLASFQSQSGENPLVQALLTEATHALASHSRGGRAP